MAGERPRACMVIEQMVVMSNELWLGMESLPQGLRPSNASSER